MVERYRQKMATGDSRYPLGQAATLLSYSATQLPSYSVGGLASGDSAESCRVETDDGVTIHVRL